MVGMHAFVHDDDYIYSNSEGACPFRYSGYLNEADFITPANMIPNATLLDYAKRKLLKQTKGALQLELVIRISVLQATWVAKYTFNLNPEFVARIDVLDAKLRDQQDELKVLRAKVCDPQPIPFIRLQADCKDNSSNQLCWRPHDCREFVVNEVNGLITVRHPGVYRIGGVVNSVPGCHNPTVNILKNGECIQHNYCAAASDYSHKISTPLDAVELLHEGDTVAVTCNSKCVSTSYLSIIRLAI
ncbi:unnamed protein product [Phytophthora lilii]|uniref:Unnamed protein product n=1 Tax=Phytophthora lilii TaxID=2077276 RepID=A0A9W6WUS4_9STRA|nr:unnamed protein product [Phytophthora lilii]